jgi:hypothetical protein
MIDSPENETAAQKMETVQASFGFACRLYVDVCEGRITTDIYKRDAFVTTGGGGVHIPPFDEATDEDLKAAINNMLLLAFYSSAIATDQILCDVFGGTYLKDSDQSRKGIRVLVRLLRNAFSHNPWYPKWKISRDQRQIFPIKLDDGSYFNFDATKLHGSGIQPIQIGGVEFWISLLAHCQRLVST